MKPEPLPARCRLRREKLLDEIDRRDQGGGAACGELLVGMPPPGRDPIKWINCRFAEIRRDARHLEQLGWIERVPGGKVVPWYPRPVIAWRVARQEF